MDNIIERGRRTAGEARADLRRHRRVNGGKGRPRITDVVEGVVFAARVDAKAIEDGTIKVGSLGGGSAKGNVMNETFVKHELTESDGVGTVPGSTRDNHEIDEAVAREATGISTQTVPSVFDGAERAERGATVKMCCDGLNGAHAVFRAKGGSSGHFSPGTRGPGRAWGDNRAGTGRDEGVFRDFLRCRLFESQRSRQTKKSTKNRATRAAVGARRVCRQRHGCS